MAGVLQGVPASAWLLALAIAVAAGLLFAHWRRRHKRGRRGRQRAHGGVPGLDYRLSEGPDPELEGLLAEADAERDPLAARFDLGEQLRAQGELDRAVRVHQLLLARTGLDADTRARVELELARDYLAAGLLNRAEALLEPLLARDDGLRLDALEALLALRQRERDWAAAIAVAEQLAAADGVESDTALETGAAAAIARTLAHLHCESAQALGPPRPMWRPMWDTHVRQVPRQVPDTHRKERDTHGKGRDTHEPDTHAPVPDTKEVLDTQEPAMLDTQEPAALDTQETPSREGPSRDTQGTERARELIRRALDWDPGCVRASLLGARLELAMGHPRVAVRHLERIRRQDPRFLAVALPDLVHAHAELGSGRDLLGVLESWIDVNPSPAVAVPLADRVAHHFGYEVARGLLVRLLERQRPGPEVAALRSRHDSAEPRPAAEVVAELAPGIAALQANRYRCEACGHTGAVLYWQCPACRLWGQTAPL